MKFSNLNNRVFFTCFLLFWGIVLSYGQVSQKTYQTIIAGDAESVKVDIENAVVNYKETKGTRILVETSIKLSVPNEALLTFIVENGRYELTQSLDAGTRELVIASKKNRNVIIVKGEECKEIVVYDIYIPASMRTVKE